MKNNKSIKLGLVGALVVGLSSCYMMGDSYHHDEYSAQEQMHHHGKMSQHDHMNHQGAQAATHNKMAAKASKEPMQKATPGPKQKAAPQLPVIQ
jgi:hypothetical protein